MEVLPDCSPQKFLTQATLHLASAGLKSYHLHVSTSLAEAAPVPGKEILAAIFKMHLSLSLDLGVLACLMTSVLIWAQKCHQFPVVQVSPCFKEGTGDF